MAALSDGLRPDRHEPLPLHLGDELQLKKAHPCGSDRWRVLRVGADIRLQCVGCGRLVLVPRAHIERRIRRIFPAPPGAGLPAEGGGERPEG